MKNYWETFKIIWNDTRGRALIKLVLYLAFAVLAVFYTRSLYEDRVPSNPKPSVMQAYIEKGLYEELITVDGIDYSLAVEDLVRFNNGNEYYSILNGKVMCDNEDVTSKFDVHFWELTPKFIGNLVKDKVMFYETKYSDGSKETAYKISLNDFLLAYNELVPEGNEIDDEYVTIVLHQTTEKVEKVTLDLSAYYKYKTENIKEYKIEIQY